MSLTRDQLAAAMPHAPKARLDAYYPFIVEAMDAGQINTPKRIAAFLAQVGHESLDFKYLSEIWGPTPAQRKYGKRKDLGNTRPEAIAAAAAHGDEPGHFYMGHGALQDTGHDNHKAAGEYIGIDAVNNPKLLATPEYAFRAAEHFWTRNNLNRYADRDQFETLTRRINGGVNGLDDRLERWAVAKRALMKPGPAIAEEATQGPVVEAVPLTPAASTATVLAIATPPVPTLAVEGQPSPEIPAVRVAEPVVGGGPQDAAVSADGQPFWKRAMTLATGGGISIAAITGGIQALTGLSPTAQVIVISAVIIGAVLFGLIVLLYFAVDRLLVKYAKSRPDRINVA